MKNSSIKNVVAVGIGAALFVVIGMINIPTLAPNTSIQLQYAVEALFAVIFGPLVGFLTGFIGHALKDAIQFGNPWWTWVLGSGIFGLLIGLIGKRLRVSQGIFDKKDLVTFNLTQLGANILVWAVLAPIGDIAVYHEAANKVFFQGLVSGSVNALTVAIAGSILLITYAKRQTKLGSLSKD